MNNHKNKIAITTGDPNGIGAEITIKALNLLDLPADSIVLISDKKILERYGELNTRYEIICVDYDTKIDTGKISASAGEFSYQSIKKACEILPKAIVTAPVAKESLHLAGHYFNGQTEILERFLAHCEQKADMLFVAGDFKVLLLTRHVPLKDIKITEELIIEKINNLMTFFSQKTNNKTPRLALCGLNPHAGENGILGREEKDIIIPAIELLRNRGINITNPLASDSLFTNAIQNKLNNRKQEYDCYIAMYHDQGLIPIKSVASDETVNMTIGLDIIRTSPAHGTAFDIAGKNIANPNSMISAIKTAFEYSKL